MITPELISYIKTERAKNTPDSLIKSNLLANGWSESDVREAMPVSSSGVPQPPISISETDLRRYRNKVTLITFCVLLTIDVLIIALFLAVQGTWGIYGISFPSIILRLLVIYIISVFATRGISPDKNKTKTITYNIFRVIGSIFLIIGIAVGVFFLGCLFLYSGVFR